MTRSPIVACLVVLAVACSSEAQPRKVVLVDAPGAGEIEPMIAGELAAAAVAHQQLIVYVGASWCEPCRYFHDAATAGTLDAALGGVRFLELDADRDTDALEAAGYRSNLIPLFAIPRADGRASGKQIEGAIKGDDAVAHIVPRLSALLGR